MSGLENIITMRHGNFNIFYSLFLLNSRFVLTVYILLQFGRVGEIFHNASYLSITPIICSSFLLDCCFVIEYLHIFVIFYMALKSLYNFAKKAFFTYFILFSYLLPLLTLFSFLIIVFLLFDFCSDHDAGFCPDRWACFI